MTDPIAIANQRFDGPYSCSQAIFSAFAPLYGLSDEQAVKISSPFGGGLAQQGHVCGAVSGALMVIGLAANGSTDPEDKENVYRLGQEFLEKFSARHETIACRELTGYDFSNPGELQAAKDKQVSTTRCPKFVNSAAELLVEILNKQS